MTELFRRKKLKELIKKLHEGESIAKLREEFKSLIEGLSPLDVVHVEQELIEEGVPPEEIHKLCDVHIELMRSAIEEFKPIAEEGHPVGILMREHSEMVKRANQLLDLATKLSETSDRSLIDDILKLIEDFKNSENHYLREEYALFPYLEKHGITQPPKIMWMDHDNIRDVKGKLFSIGEKLKQEENLSATAKLLKKITLSLFELISAHFYKENNVLFPTALKVMTPEEWIEVREQFDEIGYPNYIEVKELPERLLKEASSEEREPEVSPEEIDLDTGKLTVRELKAILDTLPVDITFVDKNNIVRYFNDKADKIFLRTKAILGRTVQNCHPQKSIHIVNKIIEDLRSGRRDHVDFWINFKGKFVFIRYLAVRDKSGEFLGVLEVTQDITEIRKLEGERRIYAEEE